MFASLPRSFVLVLVRCAVLYLSSSWGRIGIGAVSGAAILLHSLLFLIVLGEIVLDVGCTDGISAFRSAFLSSVERRASVRGSCMDNGGHDVMTMANQPTHDKACTPASCGKIIE